MYFDPTVSPVLSGNSKRRPTFVFKLEYRLVQWELSVLLSTFIKLLFASKIFVLSIFEWPFKTGFTVFIFLNPLVNYDEALKSK